MAHYPDWASLDPALAETISQSRVMEACRQLLQAPKLSEFAAENGGLAEAIWYAYGAPFIGLEYANVKDIQFAGGAKGDGVTDDTAAIQAALDYIGGVGGGVVYVPRGDYKISQVLKIWSNTTFDGVGYASHLFRADGAEIHLLENKNRAQNDTGNVNIIVRNLRFDGRRTGDVDIPGRWCVYLSRVTNSHIQNCYVHSSDSGPITLEFAQWSSYTDNIIWDGNKPGIYFSCCDWCEANNNIIHSEMHSSIAQGVALACSWRCTVNGNVVTGIPNGGIGIGRDSRWNTIANNNVCNIGTESEPIPITYTNYLNTVNRPGRGGINDGIEYGAYDNLIIGNVIEGSVTVPGINLRESARNALIGNMIGNCQLQGIRLQGAPDTVIRGNSIRNVGMAQSGTARWAIQAVTHEGIKCDALIVEENVVQDTQDTPTSYGFNLDDATAAPGIVRGNRITSEVSFPYSLDGDSLPMVSLGNYWGTALDGPYVSTTPWDAPNYRVSGVQVVGAQGAAVADVVLTADTGTLPTAGDSLELVDADNPTPAELLQLIVSEKAKNDALRARLRAHGLIAT